MAGYSGTPLVKKLGIKARSRLYLSGAPDNYLRLVAPLPEGVQVESRFHRETDIVHIFCTVQKQMANEIRSSAAGLKDDGSIWVSWPKRSSKVPTDITEDKIREIALPLGLVDVKVCAVDDTWSALKLVFRREKRHTGQH